MKPKLLFMGDESSSERNKRIFKTMVNEFKEINKNGKDIHVVNIQQHKNI
jgi:hypothetical protein